MTTTTTPTTTETSMTEPTMPYLWTMNQLERYNGNRNYYFFPPDTMRFFSSRIQMTPPYKGRVFVTSERRNWNSPRLYSVRVIQPSGNIETVGDFQGFFTRHSAHAYAKAYAAQNFVRVGNESMRLPKEIKIV